MDLRFYLSLFLRRLHWFLLIAVLVSGVGLVLARVLPTVYVASAKLVVESEQIPSDLAASTVEVQAGEQLQIIRDNMPFGAVGKAEFGTYFIGYARQPERIERMLENMFVGSPPGNYDRILDFSQAVTGTLFFVPTASFLDDVED